jgi:hypothetical protein
LYKISEFMAFKQLKQKLINSVQKINFLFLS